MAGDDPGQQERGRDAERPRQIPRSGWRDILLRLKNEISRDYLSLVSAGVAFYLLLAVFPALAALISLYGIVADPQQVTEQITALEGVIPQQGMQILEQQMTSVARGSGTGLGLGALVGILLTIWSSGKGVRALIQGMNIAYDEQEKRGFLKLNATILLFTFGAIIFALGTLATVALVPALISLLSLPKMVGLLISMLRWPVLLLAVMVALALIYRFAPSRTSAQWAWVTPGSIVAAVLWLLGSALFSLYVSNFGDYNKTYGSVGAVVILMLWFYITAFVIVLGGALNAEMEHQTRHDTTVAPDEAMGERGAVKADHLGPSP